MFAKFRFVLFALLIAAGVLGVWLVQNSGLPTQVSAQSVSLPQKQAVLESLRGIDGQLAQQIRSFDTQSFTTFSLPQSIADASQATLSATFSTSPTQLWQDIRQNGAQAAVGTVMTQAKIQVGDISADVMNEARYQYCRGVVETYESSVKTSTP